MHISNKSKRRLEILTAPFRSPPPPISNVNTKISEGGVGEGATKNPNLDPNL